jgi:hypothetical protein
VLSKGESLSWLISAGGPFIVLPDSTRDRWQGVDPDCEFDGPYDTWGDYGRACAVVSGADAEHHVAVLNVGCSQALVLGEGKGSVTFLRERLLFVQYAPSGSEEDFLAGLDARLANLPWRKSRCTWTVPGPARLVDSSCPGDDPDGHLTVDIPPGTYSLSFADSGQIFVRMDPIVDRSDSSWSSA